MMQIEEGKYYKTRDGRRVGPAFVTGDTAVFGSTKNHFSAVWTGNGRQSDRGDLTTENNNDIVAEWADGPTRKRTVTEIVPGVYGRLKVEKSGGDTSFAFLDRCGADFGGCRAVLNTTELTDAIATLTAIRDALAEVA